MGKIITEGLKRIGEIDDNGLIFDESGDIIAVISDEGYIFDSLGNKCLGKIHNDGSILDASLSNVVGRIQADGYVYIHSKRVCKVSSAFIKRITPGAWNAGQPSTYSGRKKESKKTYPDSDSGAAGFFVSPFFFKLIAGIILAIVAMVNGMGGFELLITVPICVFLLCFIAKLFS